MGRGRRPRGGISATNAVQPLSSTTGGTATASQTRSLNIMTQSNADDHCYASPKRKENKIDPAKNLILKTVLAKEMNVENRRTINLRRNRAISSYFSATASTVSSIVTQTPKTKDSPTKTMNTRLDKNIIDLTDESASSVIQKTALVSNNNFLNNPKLFGATASSLTPGNNGINKSINNFIGVLSNGSSDNSNDDIKNNIFLQEPVLTLNVNAMESSASSVIIRKNFSELTPPNFGTSPQQLHHNVTHQPFNGNKIELLCDDDDDDDDPEAANKMPLDLSKSTQYDHIDSTTSAITRSGAAAQTASFLINENSNNSCDSGVVVEKVDLLDTGNQIRKPITPHRILCPSPVKHVMPTHPYHNNQSTLANNDKRNMKSKKRLNVNDECEENIPKNLITTTTTAIVIDDDDDECETITETKCTTLNQKEVTVVQNGTATIKGATTTGVTTAGGNKTLTEYFQVRRSVRKTKKEVQEEKNRSIERAVIEGREDGLKVRIFSNKGRGIVTTRTFSRGEFVIEYVGDLINYAEAQRREQMYAEDLNTGCYMYYFRFNNQQYCIDATAESGRLGRLVNHSRNGNLVPKTMVIKNKPRLLLFANKDIEPGQEITYDYGDRSKESLANHPWLAQ